MENSLLKIVSISSKGYKKQLLLNASEVATMAIFLKDILQNDVMIINTNLSLDIYYYDKLGQCELIKDTFLLSVAPKNKTASEYQFRSFNTTHNISHETEALFLRLSEMPLFFKSYSKSLFYQISGNYESNRSILVDVFQIWQTVLLDLNAQEDHAQKFKSFLATLQKSYILYQCHPELRSLLEDALAPLHVN